VAEWLLSYELQIRLSVLAGVLLTMVVLDNTLPARTRTLAWITRWWSAIALTSINSILIRLLFPMVGTTLALWCAHNSLGLMNQIDLPWSVALIASLLALDFVVYAQHRLFHRVDFL
jgi:sterol desaturase/sphingolipid hydroxylase (fatty acid hydroxylase superfamily)